MRMGAPKARMTKVKVKTSRNLAERPLMCPEAPLNSVGGSG